MLQLLFVRWHAAQLRAQRLLKIADCGCGLKRGGDLLPVEVPVVVPAVVWYLHADFYWALQNAVRSSIQWEKLINASATHFRRCWNFKISN